MKKDVPFLVMLVFLVLTSLAFLILSSPPTVAPERSEDSMGAIRRVVTMGGFHREASGPGELFSPVAEASR